MCVLFVARSRREDKGMEEADAVFIEDNPREMEESVLLFLLQKLKSLAVYSFYCSRKYLKCKWADKDIAQNEKKFIIWFNCRYVIQYK